MLAKWCFTDFLVRIEGVDAPSPNDDCSKDQPARCLRHECQILRTFPRSLVLHRFLSIGELILNGKIDGNGTLDVKVLTIDDIRNLTGDEPEDSIGIYFDITYANGTLGWINITIHYDELPSGIDVNLLRIYYWEGTSWKLAEQIVGKNPKVLACPEYSNNLPPQFVVK